MEEEEVCRRSSRSCRSCYSCEQQEDETLTIFHRLVSSVDRKEKRCHRVCLFTLAALLLITAAALASLLMFRGRSQEAADGQTTNEPDNQSPDIKQLQATDFKKPSAMLTAPTPTGGNTDGEYLKWERERGNAHCHGGFNYSSGNLIVPRDGIYRVFLQITYESRNICSGELKLINIVFSIKDSYNDNIPLMSSVDTVNCSMKLWSKSLYSAGLFYLEANSRLRVKSSHPYLIINTEDLVFFGAELLTQLESRE